MIGRQDLYIQGQDRMVAAVFCGCSCAEFSAFGGRNKNSIGVISARALHFLHKRGAKEKQASLCDRTLKALVLAMDVHEELLKVPAFEVSRPCVQRYKIISRSRLRVPMRTKNSRHRSDFLGEQSESLLSINSDSESDPDHFYDDVCADELRWGECNMNKSADDSDLNLIPPRIYQTSSKLACCGIECNLM
uniref:Uncharacterized protein n=1 Tax=Schistocephalus solidus TaxID=70667 RepID=A0A0V0JAC8_SCHSO